MPCAPNTRGHARQTHSPDTRRTLTGAHPHLQASRCEGSACRCPVQVASCCRWVRRCTPSQLLTAVHFPAANQRPARRTPARWHSLDTRWTPNQRLAMRTPALRSAGSVDLRTAALICERPGPRLVWGYGAGAHQAPTVTRQAWREQPDPADSAEANPGQHDLGPRHRVLHLLSSVVDHLIVCDTRTRRGSGSY